MLCVLSCKLSRRMERMGKLVIIKMIIKVESTHQHLFGPGTSRDVHIIEFRSSWDIHFVPPFHWSYCCYAVRWKINLEQRNPKKMLYNFHCFGSAAASAEVFLCCAFFSRLHNQHPICTQTLRLSWNIFQFSRCLRECSLCVEEFLCQSTVARSN